MARVRLSLPAQTDLDAILETSLERWGEEGRSRYAALLAAAIRKVAADPRGPTTKDRGDLAAGLRSFHVRHARGRLGIDTPVHVIYYRSTAPRSIEVVRVLHERMEASRQLEQPAAVERQRRGRRR